MPNYVKTADLDPSKISGKEMETKSMKSDAAKTYLQIPLQYNYGTEENPAKDTIRIQLPKVTCSGIKPNKYNPDNSLINVRFDKTNPECRMFIEKFPQVFRKTCEVLYGQRKAARVPYFEIDRPEASKYRSAMFYPSDPKTDEPKLDENPFMQIKLTKNGTPPNEVKSLFTDLKKKPIDWELLKGVSLTLIPLISIDKIYIGSNPSLQVKLISAVVCQARKMGTQTMQDEATDEYLLENPNADVELEEQLAQLMNSRSDALGSPNTAAAAAAGPSSSNEPRINQIANFLSSKPTGGPGPQMTTLHNSGDDAPAPPPSTPAMPSGVGVPKPNFLLPNPALSGPRLNVTHAAN